MTYRNAFCEVDLKFIRCTTLWKSLYIGQTCITCGVILVFERSWERSLESVLNRYVSGWSWSILYMKCLNVCACNQRTGSRWSVGGEAAELRACLITALMGNKDELRRVTGGRINLQGHNIKHTICPSEETAFLMLLNTRCFSYSSQKLKGSNDLLMVYIYLYIEIFGNQSIRISDLIWFLFDPLECISNYY